MVLPVLFKGKILTALGLCLMLLVSAASAGESFILYTGPEPDYTALPTLNGVETVTVCDTETVFGGRYFLHGLAVEELHEKLYVTYAFNAIKENVFGEQCFYQVSGDGGATWSAPREIRPDDDTRSASHGVLFVKDGVLYCMLPAVDFLSSPWVVTNELHRYNEETDEWTFVADLAVGFWPNCRPERMENGNWIVMGAGSGNARVMISDGGDILSWHFSNFKKSLMGSETTAVVNGSQVLALCRPKAATVASSLGRGQDRYVVVTAYSCDYGETFTPAAQSALFCSPSKIYGGVLSDGRPYAIFNQCVEYNDARSRLVLAVGDAGGVSFNGLYTLLEYDGSICYPYAIERGGALYVAYSRSIAERNNGNQNDAALLRLPLNEIP